jgi:hypothetical protein
MMSTGRRPGSTRISTDTGEFQSMKYALAARIAFDHIGSRKIGGAGLQAKE